MLNERWIKIQGFPKYSVSCRGRVRNDQTNTILKFHDVNGYWKVKLFNEGSRKAFRVHRLVMLNHKPIADHSEMEVDHIDDNPKNNKLENLKWVTREKNMKKRWSK